MNTKILLPLLWIVPGSSLRGIDLHLRDGMMLRDFYEQDIYPQVNIHSGIAFSLGPLEFIIPGKGKVFELEHARASFRFTVRNEVRGGMINTFEPVSIEHATKLLEQAAERLAVEPKYGSFPRNTPPSSTGASWTSMAVSYEIPDSKWTFTVLGKRSEEMVFLHVFLDKPTTRREDTEFVLEWGDAPMLKAPKEWEHLPLHGNWRGLDPEVQKFTYLVSSYDEEGKLLPKFQKLRDEIEATAAVKIQNLPSRPKRSHSEDVVPAPEEEKEENGWIWVSLAILLAACGYYGYRRWKAV